MMKRLSHCLRLRWIFGMMAAALMTGCALADPRIAFEELEEEPIEGPVVVDHDSGVVISEWKKPQLNYYPNGETTTFKRYERWPQRDFVHHFFRQAYYVPSPRFRGEAPDQAVILQEWGLPDYVRKPFESFEYESVEEWVYLDEYKIFQFVEDEMVYDGPLTDYEQTLMRYGYPNRATTIIDEHGRVIHSFIYRQIIFPSRLVSFFFSNDVMVQVTQGS